MSAVITEIYKGYRDSVGNNVIQARIACDTFADLPAATAFPGFLLAIDSSALIIDVASEYRLSSAGVWYLYQPGAADVYTKQQTDDLLAEALRNVQTTNITNTIEATAEAPFSVDTLTQVGSYQYTSASLPYISGLPTGVNNPARIDVIALPAARRQQILRPTGSIPSIYIRNSTGAGYQAWYTVSLAPV